MRYQNLRDGVKVCLRGKFRAVNTYNKKEGFQIKNLTRYLRNEKRKSKLNLKLEINDQKLVPFKD